LTTGPTAAAAFSPAAKVAAVSSWNVILVGTMPVPLYMQILAYGVVVATGALFFCPSAASTTDADGQGVFEIGEAFIVAAAGNYGDTTPCWPAAFRRVVSVAALGPDMLPSQWSSRGFSVTCSTIGQGVRSTFVEGRESALIDPVPQTFGPDAWALWSGTSFAAPQITGALALLHEQYGYPLRDALRVLLAAGRPVPQFGQALRILPGQ
jgi:hypothetical protein